MLPQDHPMRAARCRERFSLRQLAIVTGIHRSRLHAIECGAPASTIERRIIGAALRVPPSSLVLGEHTAIEAVQR
jgi:hypothetical protein